MAMKFSKPPILDEIEKERLKEEFLHGAHNVPIKTKSVKQPIKAYLLRMPENLFDTLKEISDITGQPIKSICLEFIWDAAKERIKYLKG